jgi:hypothetical protein
VEILEWKEFVDGLKKQWRTLWRDRIDDRVRAEGIANRDYSMLFVERGLVVVATRDYKPLDFVEILQKHKPPNVNDNVVPPSPYVGGWGKFIRDFISKQKRFTRKGRPVPSEPERKEKQQSKKGGRGWLHFRMRE